MARGALREAPPKGHAAVLIGQGGPAFAPVPRLALSKPEAAEALGVSVDHFERHILGHVRTVPAGRRVLVPVAELLAYLDRQAV